MCGPSSEVVKLTLAWIPLSHATGSPGCAFSFYLVILFHTEVRNHAVTLITFFLDAELSGLSVLLSLAR